jgi:hypothetical protein
MATAICRHCFDSFYRFVAPVNNFIRQHTAACIRGGLDGEEEFKLKNRTLDKKADMSRSDADIRNEVRFADSIGFNCTMWHDAPEKTRPKAVFWESTFHSNRELTSARASADRLVAESNPPFGGFIST